jgi:hypothetical protein
VKVAALPTVVAAGSMKMIMTRSMTRTMMMRTRVWAIDEAMKKTRMITMAAIGTGPGMKKMKTMIMTVTEQGAMERRMIMKTPGMTMTMKVTKMRTMIMEGASAAVVEKEAALMVEAAIIRDVALAAWIRNNNEE